MTTRKFKFSFGIWGEIELDQKVIDAVDDEWRSVFYSHIKTPEDVVEMVAHCLLRGWSLSSMDGWANLSNMDALIIDENWEVDEIKEIKHE